jgi:hypothetical protein
MPWQRMPPMSYSLSFADKFFIQDDAASIRPSERPISVYQAILSINEDTWRDIARDVFGIMPVRLTPEAVLDKIIETDTCSNLDVPVEVWIDDEGYFSVVVHDRP